MKGGLKHRVCNQQGTNAKVMKTSSSKINTIKKSDSLILKESLKENYESNDSSRRILERLMMQNTTGEINQLKERPNDNIFIKPTPYESIIEKQQNQIYVLENDVRVLENEFQNERRLYRESLEKLSNVINSCKQLQQTLLDEKKRRLESEERLEEIRESTKKCLNFLLAIFQSITLLPELIEIDSLSKKLLEFSFEKKSSEKINKNKFIQNQFVDFFEKNAVIVEQFELQADLLSIIEKFESSKFADRYNVQKDEDDYNKDFIAAKHDYNNSCQLQSTSKKLNSSTNSNDVGINSNYNINISLVLKDQNTSESIESSICSAAKNNFKLKSFFKNDIIGDQISSLNSSAQEDILGSLGDNSLSIVTTNRTGDETSVVAAYDFNAEKDSDLTFEKGDRIQVLERQLNGWWVGRNIRTLKCGYFPSNFITNK